MRWLYFAAALSVAQGTQARPSKEDYRLQAASHTGDPIAGRTLFSDARTSCNRCHSIDGTSSKAGPDLFAIGDKFTRPDLIRSVLEPSATIAVGYGTTVVETKNGDMIQGVVKQATDAWVELADGSGQRSRITTTDILSQRTSPQSLMPEGLESALSTGEFTDLIAYLGTLKQSTEGLASRRGAPASIPRAAREVTFSSLFREEVRFDHPVWCGEVPGQTNLFIVMEHSGRAFLIHHSESEDTRSLLLDLRPQVRTGGATGLLGLAFHPAFRENRKYYLKYHDVVDGKISTVLVERRFAADFQTDAGETARELIRIPAVTQDHNGGCIEFGPDGYLYLGTGDTGPQRDPQGHGQDLGLLIGKILRLDVNRNDPGLAYAIPSDNPFRGREGVRPEIWAYGFREPWRFTFDSATGDLWVGDVGQDRIEEVGIVRSGENHGWNVYEGFDAFSPTFRREGERYVSPVFSYPHRIGVSVTGGYVYHGTKAPALGGWYVCADFESRRVWALTQTNRVLDQLVEIGRAPSRAVSFTHFADGELGLVGYDSGIIYKLGLDVVDPTPLASRMLAGTAESGPVRWRFTLTAPAGDWNATSFNDGDWTEAAGGFGTSGTPGAIIGREWSTGDIWLRRTFTAPAIPAAAALFLRVHHDEDAEVYINGAVAARLPRWTSGYVEVPLSIEAAKALHSGTNTIAIHCHQNSGGQYIDAGLVEYYRP